MIQGVIRLPGRQVGGLIIMTGDFNSKSQCGYTRQRRRCVLLVNTHGNVSQTVPFSSVGVSQAPCVAEPVIGCYRFHIITGHLSTDFLLGEGVCTPYLPDALRISYPKCSHRLALCRCCLRRRVVASLQLLADTDLGYDNILMRGI